MKQTPPFKTIFFVNCSFYISAHLKITNHVISAIKTLHIQILICTNVE